MPAKTDSVILQKDIPLSKCLLWDLHRKFYLEHGIQAWNQKMPFYITSNPFIAYAYAHIIIRFIQDCRQSLQCDPQEPFYILELGAGHGLFGYYMLKNLIELRKQLALENLGMVYLMTDLVESNLEYWRGHPALHSYVEQGLLDFAVYDLEKDAAIKLCNSKKLLKKFSAREKMKNPLIVLANYIFDTIPHDLFRLTEGQLQQGLVTLKTPAGNIKDGSAINPEEISLHFTYQDIRLPFYEKDACNQLLSYYQNEMGQGYFSIPVAGLEAITHLMDISGNRLFLLTTDKGFADHYGWYAKDEEVIANYMNSSMLVNFQAMGQYFRNQGGDDYHQATRQTITTSVFWIGLKSDQLPETKQALSYYLNTVGPGDIYNLSAHFLNTHHLCNLDTIVSQLNATGWDPQIFNFCLNTILAQLKSASPVVLHDLTEGMRKIAANFYYMPGCMDTLFHIGLFFHQINDCKSAITYYQQSIHWFGEQAPTWYNIGLCRYGLKECDEALLAFEKSVNLDPSFILAKGWMQHVRETDLEDREYPPLATVPQTNLPAGAAPLRNESSSNKMDANNPVFKYHNKSTAADVEGLKRFELGNFSL